MATLGICRPFPMGRQWFMTTPSEVLVVVDDPARYAAAVAALRRVGVVTQLLPPRLAVVRIAPGSDLPHVPGTTVYVGRPDVDLSKSERIFVDAWLARDQPKDRVGDGLPWDAPGFEAPDWSPDQGPDLGTRTPSD